MFISSIIQNKRKTEKGTSVSFRLQHNTKQNKKDKCASVCFVYNTKQKKNGKAECVVSSILRVTSSVNFSFKGESISVVFVSVLALLCVV